MCALCAPRKIALHSISLHLVRAKAWRKFVDYTSARTHTHTLYRTNCKRKDLIISVTNYSRNFYFELNNEKSNSGNNNNNNDSIENERKKMKSESLAECCAALLLLERNQHISNSLSIKVNLSSVGQRMQWARVRLCCCHSVRCRCAYSLLFLRFCFVLTMFSGHGWPTSSYTDHWQWTCTDCCRCLCWLWVCFSV